MIVLELCIIAVYLPLLPPQHNNDHGHHSPRISQTPCRRCGHYRRGRSHAILNTGSLKQGSRCGWWKGRDGRKRCQGLQTLVHHQVVNDVHYTVPGQNITLRDTGTHGMGSIQFLDGLDTRISFFTDNHVPQPTIVTFNWFIVLSHFDQFVTPQEFFENHILENCFGQFQQIN